MSSTLGRCKTTYARQPNSPTAAARPQTISPTRRRRDGFPEGLPVAMPGGGVMGSCLLTEREQSGGGPGDRRLSPPQHFPQLLDAHARNFVLRIEAQRLFECASRVLESLQPQQNRPVIELQRGIQRRQLHRLCQMRLGFRKLILPRQQDRQLVVCFRETG